MRDPEELARAEHKRWADAATRRGWSVGNLSGSQCDAIAASLRVGAWLERPRPSVCCHRSSQRGDGPGCRACTNEWRDFEAKRRGLWAYSARVEFNPHSDLGFVPWLGAIDNDVFGIGRALLPRIRSGDCDGHQMDFEAQKEAHETWWKGDYDRVGEHVRLVGAHPDYDCGDCDGEA